PSLHLNAPSPPDIYPLSLHDALPICAERDVPEPEIGMHFLEERHGEVPAVLRPGIERARGRAGDPELGRETQLARNAGRRPPPQDRKSTRLNSSHVAISYAVFCLKKK